MDLPKMSSGQTIASQRLYPALLVDAPGDYRNGDVVAYVNRTEYLPLLESAPDMLAALEDVLLWFGDKDPENRVTMELVKAVISKAKRRQS